MGTESGIIRAHSLENDGEFCMGKYVEKKVGYKEISALYSCPLSNVLYIGNIYGDISSVSYFNGLSVKNTNKKLIPNYASFHTLNFMLVSSAKSTTNS